MNPKNQSYLESYNYTVTISVKYDHDKEEFVWDTPLAVNKKPVVKNSARVNLKRR